jgi:hypothetical protein
MKARSKSFAGSIAVRAGVACDEVALALIPGAATPEGGGARGVVACARAVLCSAGSAATLAGALGRDAPVSVSVMPGAATPAGADASGGAVSAVAVCASAAGGFSEAAAATGVESDAGDADVSSDAGGGDDVEKDSPASVSAPLVWASVGGAMVTGCVVRGWVAPCDVGGVVCAHASAGRPANVIANKTPRIPASNARFNLLLGHQGRPHKGQWKISTISAFSNSLPIFPISGGSINPTAQPPR